jgi:hypothetical protein
MGGRGRAGICVAGERRWSQFDWVALGNSGVLSAGNGRDSRQGVANSSAANGGLAVAGERSGRPSTASQRGDLSRAGEQTGRLARQRHALVTCRQRVQRQGRGATGAKSSAHSSSRTTGREVAHARARPVRPRVGQRGGQAVLRRGVPAGSVLGPQSTAIPSSSHRDGAGLPDRDRPGRIEAGGRNSWSRDPSWARSPSVNCTGLPSSPGNSSVHGLSVPRGESETTRAAPAGQTPRETGRELRRVGSAPRARTPARPTQAPITTVHVRPQRNITECFQSLVNTRSSREGKNFSPSTPTRLG